MLHIQTDGSIGLTRGDTARLTVSISNDATNEDYELDSLDVLVLSVKKKITDTDCVFQKTITGTKTFHIEPTDTEGVPFGMYKYDVQLTTSSGDVYTVIEPTNFELLQEVTY